jgi:hypothetical protein
LAAFLVVSVVRDERQAREKMRRAVDALVASPDLSRANRLGGEALSRARPRWRPAI